MARTTRDSLPMRTADVGDEAAREAAENLTAFFRILMEWDGAGAATPSTGAPRSGDESGTGFKPNS
ncbi:hypothetical protein BH11MYX4_BH11MYX4_22580 [soil metagenome]